jgi:hypothetical protein
MDSMERRLVELNQALLKLAAGQKPTENLVLEAQRAVSGASYNINTGSGNDTVIINKTIKNCEPPHDTPTPPEPPACTCEKQCITVDSSYQATANDFYIGVNSEEPTTITLPPDCDNCQIIVIKAEMGPPLGNRKVTVTTSDGSLIDGSDDYILTTPYESVTVICNGGDWYVI